MSITDIDNFSQQFLLLVFLLKIIYYDTRVKRSEATIVDELP